MTMPTEAWRARVSEVVQQAHDENWGGAHRSDVFCKACADAQIVAQYAVPDDYGEPPCPTCGGRKVIYTDRPGATSPRPCPACATT